MCVTVPVAPSSRSPLTNVTPTASPGFSGPSNDIGVIAGSQGPDRSGNHRPEGFALFRGTSFAAGATEQEGDGRQIAPVILQQFGIDAPAHYELEAPAAIVGSPRNSRAA